MSDFTETLTKIETIKNTRERVDVSNFYVSNHVRENDCCIPSEDWEMILYYDFDPWCLIDDITEHWTPELKRKVAKIWWNEFKKVNIDDCGRTTEPFMFWPEATDQFDIMEAFKDFFDVDVIEDEKFMGMTGFTNGDALLNKEREKNDMKETKEVTFWFADNEQADVFRHGNNDYSIYFHNGDYSIRGSWLEIATEVKNYETKQVNQVNKTWNKKKEDEMALTSCGRYMNIWAIDGTYDCLIKFHEAEDDDKIDEAIKGTEDICHHIMQNKYMKTEEKRKLIDDLLDTYTEYGVGVIAITDKAKERSNN